jgi:antagonist of KipI
MLEIIDPGFLTTVQDLGRFGFQKFGVSVGGAMDTFALRAANALVGNDSNEAALEITLSAPRLCAREKCLVAITGAHFALRVNDQPVPMNTALFLRAGATLEFGAREWGAREWGARAYLALAGGIDVPLVLNSRATDLRGAFGGLGGRALRAGDVISQRTPGVQIERAGTSAADWFSAYYENGAPIRAIWGPHDDFFSDVGREKFLQSEFVVGELADRMALRLHGAPIPREHKELLSCGVTTGAIQVPPDDQPIVLMADHQTAGGYPIIGTVIRADIPRLAQKISGDGISFEIVTIEQALRAWHEIIRLAA